jgi:hypothetical protein
MKKYLYYILLVIFIKCNSQSNYITERNGYSFVIENNSEYSSIIAKTENDTIYNVKITPNIEAFYKVFLFKRTNDFVAINLTNINGKYSIESVNYKHKDSRTSAITKYVQSNFGIDLSKYKIEIIECKNLEDIKHLIIYMDPKYPIIKSSDK